MAPGKNILGIDIGSVAVSVVEITPGKDVVRRAYGFHRGDFIGEARKLLRRFQLTGLRAIACTSSTPPIFALTRQYDDRISLIAAFRHFHGAGAGTILHVGGETYGAVFFDDNGDYRHFTSNSTCAAGTGGFLDQQALRLGLSGSSELAELAANNRGATPSIATRCAVFAKTDLAHAQQEGYRLEQICDGVCRGLARNIVESLFQKRKPIRPILFTGGVSRNRAVARHIRHILGQEILVEALSPWYGALGAALHLLDDTDAPSLPPFRSADDLFSPREQKSLPVYEPLTPELSVFPDFRGLRRYEYPAGDANPVEVDLYEEMCDPDPVAEVYLGIDIGSTSTKATLVSPSRSVLGGFYTRTAGRPVEALQKIFSAIDHMAFEGGFELCFLGAGTTGAGRKLIGRLIRADLVVDEITAHARAARELLPDVDTIIEIGGQDSKFTTLNGGDVRDQVVPFEMGLEPAAFRLTALESGSYTRKARGIDNSGRIQESRPGCKPLRDRPRRGQGNS